MYKDPKELESLAPKWPSRNLLKKRLILRDPSVYDLIESTAIFKKKLQVLDPDKGDIIHDKSTFRHNVRTWEYNDGDGTSALSRRSRSIHYIVGNSGFS